MIHQTGNCFVISSRRQWLEGCFSTEKAAKYAFKFPESAIKELQEEVNKKENPDHRVISF